VNAYAEGRQSWTPPAVGPAGEGDGSRLAAEHPDWLVPGAAAGHGAAGRVGRPRKRDPRWS
jgi:hypothetical protein